MLVKIKWMIQTNHYSWFKPIFYAENWILPQIFPVSSSMYFSTVRIWAICCGIPFLFENVYEIASGSDFVNTCETVFPFSVPSPLTGIVIPSVPGLIHTQLGSMKRHEETLEYLAFSMKTVLKQNNSKPKQNFCHGTFLPSIFLNVFAFNRMCLILFCKDFQL